MIFVSSKKLFLFLRNLILCRFFPFLSTVNGHTKKGIFVDMFCNSKRLVTSFTFFFHNLVHKKKLDAKVKMKLPTFFVFFFKKNYFQKSLACIGFFGLFIKIKKGIEFVFTVYFRHTLSIKRLLSKYPMK